MSRTDLNFDLETAPKIERAHALSTGNYALPFDNIAQVLSYQFGEIPAGEFAICYIDGVSVRTILYQDLFCECQQIAAWFKESLQLSTGDRIAILTGNTPESIFLYFSAWISGICVVPINISEADERIHYIIDHSQSKYAFVSPDYSGRIENCPVLTRWPTDRDRCESIDFALPSDTEALIVYTSGTTGAPKGVILTHGNLLADAQGIARLHGFTEGDRAMCVLPLHHVNGIVVTLVTPLLTGGSVVLNRKFSASRFWKIVADEKCTWCSVVPTILAFLCESKPGDWAKPPDFRHFLCGAGPLTTDLAKKFHDRFGVRVVHGYGLSETTCYSTFLPVDLDEAEYAHWMWGCGFPSIGAALPENEVEIHDESGNALGPKTRGEIVVRGVNVMRAYFRRPDANAAAFAHGWLRTGDEGFYEMGTDGIPYYFISGRLKELFIRGGVNYSPLEIDEVLAQVPGVKAAMAVGFENDFYGEEIGAYVQPVPGTTLEASDVLEFCALHLPFAKRPKVVVFGEDFPVTSTGKYRRNELKARFADWKGAEFRR